MSTSPLPESALWERLRRQEADIVRLDERISRVEQADQQDVIAERLSTMSKKLDELASQVKWLSRTLYVLGGLIPIGAAIIAGIKP